jgi:hypothetical protein
MRVFIDEECIEWIKNKNINPKTKRKINPNSKNGIFKQLNKQCGKIASPIRINSSFIERDFTLENRIKYAKKFISRFTELEGDIINKFLIIKKDKYKFNGLILDKKIGSDSKYGIVYSTLYGKKPNQYNVATKLMCTNESNDREIIILKKITKNILAKKTIHFPIMYFDYKITTSNLNKSLLPGIISKCNEFHINFNELFSGDLKMLMNSKKHNTIFIKNTITQLFFCISTFSEYTGLIHKDAHWGNFLYHNIKPGGFFYYKINNIDVYLENIGYIWVIWDFGFARKQKTHNIHKDYSRIIKAFYPRSFNGWVPNNIGMNQDAVQFSLNIHSKLELLSYNLNSIESKKKTIHKILFELYPELLIKPADNLIINKKPYVIK